MKIYAELTKIKIVRSKDKKLYDNKLKSFTAKVLCRKLFLPTIIFTKPIPSEIDFISQLNQIQCDLVIYIDEFEKNFLPANKENNKYHNQDIFLSYMDGAINSLYKRVFIFTTNSEISSNFINRPSRIRYYKTYEFMDEKLYNDIINKQLVKKEYEEDLRENLPLYDCTIDLLKEIIEDINLHDRPYSTFKAFFNHKPRKLTYNRYEWIEKEWKFKDVIEEDQEITRKTTNIAGQWGCKVVDIMGKDLIYNVDEYRTPTGATDNEEDEEKSVRTKITYKVSLTKSQSPF